MTLETAVALGISIVALGISITTAVLSAVRFRFDLRDRKRQQVEGHPYFVVAGARKANGNPSVELTNEGSALAIQVMARSWDVHNPMDEGGTALVMQLGRLAPGESADITVLFVRDLEALVGTDAWYHKRWNDKRLDVAYRRPHEDKTYSVQPLVDLSGFETGISWYLQRKAREAREVGETKDSGEST